MWEVSPADELRLDRYEGFPTFYYKKEIRLPIKDRHMGKTKLRDAFVYIMHEERKRGIPTEAYMHTCFAGYRDFGFDTALLLAAYDRSI